MKRSSILSFIYLVIAPNAFGGEDIGSVNSELEYFDKIIDLLQTLVHLFDGPIGMAAMVISLIISIILWNVAPGRSEIVGRLCRWVVSAIVILNVAGAINYMIT